MTAPSNNNLAIAACNFTSVDESALQRVFDAFNAAVRARLIATKNMATGKYGKPERINAVNTQIDFLKVLTCDFLLEEARKILGNDGTVQVFDAVLNITDPVLGKVFNP